MGAENSLYRMIVPSMTADRVAQSAYRGFMFGQRVIAPGVSNLAFVGALRFFHTSAYGADPRRACC